jgi:hypothetical protein
MGDTKGIKSKKQHHALIYKNKGNCTFWIARKEDIC